MKTSVKSLFAIALTLLWTVSYGQNAEMADAFRADGKIYVVVAIILIVLAGLILYLFLLDRKMNKLEQMIKEKRQTKREDKAF
jgi:cytochrome c biogenesis factor